MRTPRSILNARRIFEEYGRRAYEEALAVVTKKKFEYARVREALLYFMRHCWRNCQHAALVSLACESVGGDPDAASRVAASLILLTGAADIHDDIIDQSVAKNRRLTVLGKYGRDMALLIGDALLIEGYTLLSDACIGLPEKKARKIQRLVRDGFFQLGCAEAEEASFESKWDLEPEVYLNIMKRKAAVAETAAILGAILGDGSAKEIETLGMYGRALAILVNIRHEFVDVFEHEELRNRIANECLPLPILYALKSDSLRKTITARLRGGDLSAREVSRVAQIIVDSEEVQCLRNEMAKISQTAHESISQIKGPVKRKLLQLLEAATEEIC